MIPLFSSSTANADIDFNSALQPVLERSWYILGEEVQGFETEFAHYIGVDHCISVANGTDALELALRGLGVGAGDRVVTVANAGFYSSTAIYAVGATPVYADINPITLTLDPSALQKAMASKPAAIIVTHLYGYLAAIEEIIHIAASAGVPLIEDCAQAHGARRNDRLAGSFGAIGCFSFYPTKNLGALGDGGALVTNDTQLAERVRQLRQYGWSRKYNVSIAGGRNSRLDEMQAAILRAKLPFLDVWNAQRRSIAERYNHAFAPLDVKMPTSLGDDYVAHLYVLQMRGRKNMAAFLQKRQIATDIHYPVPDHLQEAYDVSLSHTLPFTEAACDSVISLPCFPGMSDEQVGQVIAAVQAYFLQEVHKC